MLVHDKEKDLVARYVVRGETRIFGKCVKMEVEEDDEDLLANFVAWSPSGMAT